MVVLMGFSLIFFSIDTKQRIILYFYALEGNQMLHTNTKHHFYAILNIYVCCESHAVLVKL